MSAQSPRVVLASTSRYRAELLHRLFPEFQQAAPQVQETEFSGETPRRRAERLALLKAAAVAGACEHALVIGSDQVAALGGKVLHKPGNATRAREQLRACSGREVHFHTAVCLIDTRRADRCSLSADLTRVYFRHLDDGEIERYLEREQPFDCAGSFKAEALGIALFEKIESEDPTALVGLPLIALARLLREAGLRMP